MTGECHDNRNHRGNHRHTMAMVGWCVPRRMPVPESTQVEFILADEEIDPWDPIDEFASELSVK